MKNVCLVSPPEQHLLMEAGDRPNLGVLYVAGALKRAGHNISVSDLNHDNYRDLHDKLRFNDVEFLGVTTTTPYFNWVNNFAKFVKQQHPKITLVAGGPHATVDPESLAPEFDYIVRGEGERAMVDIVEGMVPERIVQYPFSKDIDKIPIPARELLPMDARYGIHQEGLRTTTLLSSRSCPFSCFFCTKNILGPKQRGQSVGRTVDEIVELKDGYGFDSLYFLDDCFTFDREKTIGLAEKLLEDDVNITFRGVTRSDRVDEEMLKLLRLAGMRSVTFGLEHADDNVLKRTQKSNNVETNSRAVQMAHDVGLKVRGSFIMNLPGATKDTMYRTLQFAMDHQLDFADFYPLIAYPGTELWKNPDKFDMKILSRDYGFYQTSGHTNVEMKDIPTRELEQTIGDIRNRWYKFKGSKTPWTLK